LETNPKYGLSEQEATKRLEEIGKNTLSISTLSMTGLIITLILFWIITIVFAVLYFEGKAHIYIFLALLTAVAATLVSVSAVNLTKKNKAADAKITEFEGLLAAEVKVLRNG